MKTLVCRDRTLITVSGNTITLRGCGWGRRKPGQSTLADVRRECHLQNRAQANAVAKLLKQMIDEDYQ